MRLIFAASWLVRVCLLWSGDVRRDAMQQRGVGPRPPPRQVAVFAAMGWSLKAFGELINSQQDSVAALGAFRRHSSGR